MPKACPECGSDEQTGWSEESVVNNRTFLPPLVSLSQRTIALMAVLAFPLASRPAFAAEDLDTQYRFDTWRATQGLPQNTVKAITQTRDGYLWFGTRFGIVRFDGVTFRVFDRVNTRPSPSISGRNKMRFGRIVLAEMICVPTE